MKRENHIKSVAPYTSFTVPLLIDDQVEKKNLEINYYH